MASRSIGIEELERAWKIALPENKTLHARGSELVDNSPHDPNYLAARSPNEIESMANPSLLPV
jgi:hypothetical protein